MDRLQGGVLLIREELPPGHIYPQLTQFPTNYADFLAAFRGGQTVDNNTHLTTGNAVQTHLYKAAIASGHLTTKGNKIQGLVDIFLTDKGADHILVPQERQFCELAVGLAKKSIHENDGELHPYVGAVVVKDGKIISTGFRGETAEGRHAEFSEESFGKDLQVSSWAYTPWRRQGQSGNLGQAANRGRGEYTCNLK